MASVLGARNSMVSLLVIALGLCIIVVSVFAYTQISALQNSSSILQYANSQLQDEVNALDTENDQLTEQSALLESQVSSLEAQVSSLEAQVDVTRTYYSKLIDRLGGYIVLYDPTFTGADEWFLVQQDHVDPVWPWLVA